MLGYIEYLGIPGQVAAAIVAAVLFMQLIGEFLEFKGKTVPEVLKWRKYFKRKKLEREAISKLPELLIKNEETSKTLQETNKLLTNVDKHYSDDNISKRNRWMNWVNEEIELNKESRKKRDEFISELAETMEKIKQDTLSILIDAKRNAIIDFAARVANKSTSVTHEQFKRIFKIHEEYKEIIEANHLTNGEVDIAFRIIEEAYEDRMKNASFLEDIRGYR